MYLPAKMRMSNAERNQHLEWIPAHLQQTRISVASAVNPMPTVATICRTDHTTQLPEIIIIIIIITAIIIIIEETKNEDEKD